jgi:hypothetical protein
MTPPPLPPPLLLLLFRLWEGEWRRDGPGEGVLLLFLLLLLLAEL